ncbi:(RS)-norcoclaurine 6-O-methyltransferase-like [Arachis ipaensis]|uniref:(RS)-norcoclaurine 6-O-methyltransferase-like n=1 Tax=Arachis ipaensis TaxID=130454 RepID=UPI0007AFA482|nr:(RS)-norcoclaurine 6-O-methyltransferase-like [Arachis ipaensis]
MTETRHGGCSNSTAARQNSSSPSSASPLSRSTPLSDASLSVLAPDGDATGDERRAPALRNLEKVSRCKTTKTIWDKLLLTQEGTEQVRETQVNKFTKEYEMFLMKEDEGIDEMFERFSVIINNLDIMGKKHTEEKLVRKILRSLVKKWKIKSIAIAEGNNLKEISYDEYLKMRNLAAAASDILAENKELHERIKNLNIDLANFAQSSENLDKVLANERPIFIKSGLSFVEKWILHDWNDEECLNILKNCKEAITSKGKGGKVIIIDMIIMEDEKKGGGDDKSVETQLFFDMLMMVLQTGKERDEKEWAKLIVSAGFSNYKITPIL